ncbi:(4Fe-4S)-binding protein [Deltaproteobacteria bacterium]|nr:(4Fe-4S)-binding protein [Deltaproteobacteria bacterium]
MTIRPGEAAPLTFDHARGRVEVQAAWTTTEVLSTVETMLSGWEAKLPAARGARIVIKPNLNNDLVALTGNCADLRVLAALIEALQRRGYTNLTVADGSNVGVERRNISSFKRLRIDALAEKYGVATVDLNRDEGRRIPLHAGAEPLVANTVLDADFLISVPKVKTHVEAGLSCAMKNWVGICVGQDKRHMHQDLGRNIFALSEVVQPDLILVDGLVGMEGNGPGDGDPFRFGYLVMADDPFLNDLVVARLVGLPVAAVPYLQHARDAGVLDDDLAARVNAEVPLLRQIQRAPARSRLAELSESPSLLWLKKAVRPIVAQPAVAELAYKAKIIQDVYSLEDDSLRLVARDAEACGDCRRCEDFCPTGLKVEEIGVKLEIPDCVQCLYCWWVCPKQALTLSGEPAAMERQIARYKGVIEDI